MVLECIHKSIKFHAGVDQVCLLTKKMPVYNFSEKIIEISKKFNVKDEVSNKRDRERERERRL